MLYVDRGRSERGEIIHNLTHNANTKYRLHDLTWTRKEVVDLKVMALTTNDVEYVWQENTYVGSTKIIHVKKKRNTIFCYKQIKREQ